MRLLVSIFCLLFLTSCTTSVTEIWSWNAASDSFVLQKMPPGESIFGNKKRVTCPLEKGGENSDGTWGIGEESECEGKSDKILSSDLDGDGLSETFALSSGKITATEDEKIFWESPVEWRVTDIILADSTNDGIIDLNIATWRNANYGPSKPFWEEENDTTPRHHFFVMKMQDNTIMPVWQSSNLEAINQELRIADVDGDEKNELVVIERDYEEKEDCTNTVLAVWRWNEWGFYNVWKSPRGNYCGLEIQNGNMIVHNNK